MVELKINNGYLENHKMFGTYTSANSYEPKTESQCKWENILITTYYNLWFATKGILGIKIIT